MKYQCEHFIFRRTQIISRLNTITTLIFILYSKVVYITMVNRILGDSRKQIQVSIIYLIVQLKF